MSKKTYLEAAHALQTGVRIDQEVLGSTDGTPKHLRVGVNIAMCDHSSLVRLLIKKGIITDEEYLAAITDGLNEEVDRYEKRLNVKLG